MIKFDMHEVVFIFNVSTVFHKFFMAFDHQNILDYAFGYAFYYTKF